MLLLVVQYVSQRVVCAESCCANAVLCLAVVYRPIVPQLIVKPPQHMVTYNWVVESVCTAVSDVHCANSGQGPAYAMPTHRSSAWIWVCRKSAREPRAALLSRTVDGQRDVSWANLRRIRAIASEVSGRDEYI